MRKITLFVLVLVLVPLTACSGSLEDQDVALTIDVNEIIPTETIEVETVVEVVVPTATEETLEPEITPELVVNLESECTLVSSLPDPPQEYAEIFSVTEDDWVIGPEDALVTLIEYGDFQ